MGRSKAGSIDEYVAEFPPATRRALEEVRAAIHGAAPEAVETISYAMPTFDLYGRHLVHFAGFAHHVGFYPVHAANAEEFEDDLRGYKRGKGSVQFPLDRPMPVDLVRRIVAYRVAEAARAASARAKPRARTGDTTYKETVMPATKEKTGSKGTERRGATELPDTLKRSPKKAQETYLKAHDSAVETYGEGERAHRTALAALKHSFEKVGDHWEPKEKKGPSDPRAKNPRARENKGESFGGVDVFGHSKTELLKRARELGVAGRSSMNKEELARAIAKKQD